jgi:hypothetical protein
MRDSIHESTARSSKAEALAPSLTMPGKFPRRIRRYSSDRERPVRRMTSGNRSNRVGHSMSESRDAPLRRKREQNIPAGYVARLFIQHEREVHANRALGFFA